MTSDALESDNYCSSVATANCDIAAASFDAEIQQEMLLVWPYPKKIRIAKFRSYEFLQ
jgi:hypothetical protein